MFKALLQVQWKWTRGAALLATIIGFAIPLMSIQSMNGRQDDLLALRVVSAMEDFGAAYALLAAGVGLAFALFAWGHDHRGRHVYALSLPVGRSRYVLMRFGAGALFLLLPGLGVFAGSLVAIGIAAIPAGMHAYPVSLALRFLLASAVSFAIFFAIAASTARAAAVVLGSLALLLITAFFIAATSMDVDVISPVRAFVFGEIGPLAVFTGRWMLIDA